MNENQIEKLIALNKELVFLNKESEKLSDELTKTNKKLIKAEEKTIKIQRLYAFISQVNQNIVRINDEATLFQNACRIAHEFGKFKMAWIGIFNKENKTINLVGQCGIEPEDLKFFRNTPWQTKCPQDYVLQIGTYYLCNDVEHDFEVKRWKPYMRKKGIRSLMIIPIKKSGVIIGTLNLYSIELNFAEKEEIALLIEVAGDISFALDRFEKEKKHNEIEDQLIQSEKRFRAMIEKGSDIITLRSPEGKFSYVSPSVSVALGYNKEELLSMPGFDLVHPEDLPEMIEQTQLIAKKPGSFYKRQQRFRHKNGSWIWGEGTVTNLLDEPGINAFVTNFRDISEKKLEEQQREFDSYNLNALINNTEDLMWSVDRDLNLITSNKPFDEMITFLTGSTLSKGSNALNIGFPKEQLKRFKAYYERAFAGETFNEIEHTESPHEIWSEISFYPIRKEDEVIGTACHSRNITNIKKVEQQLSVSLERLKEAQALANTGSWEFDFKKNMHTWSDQLYTIFGIENKSKQPSTEFFLSLIHPEDADEIRIKVEKAFQTLNATSYHFRFIRKDGELRYGYTERKFEFDNNNNPLRLVGVVQDITERKLVENEIRLEQKNLKESQAVAHLGSWELNFATNIALWSEECCRIYGLSIHNNRHSFENWISFIHPEDLNYVMTAINESQKTLSDTNLNHRIILKDGSVKHIYSKSKLVFNHDGKPTGIYGITHDVTEDKIIKTKLELSEAHMAEAQRLAKLGSWNFDIKADRLTWSDELYNVFDTDKQTFFENHGSFIHLIDKEDRDLALQTSKNAQITGEPFTIEYGITTSKGERRIIKEHGYGQKDEEGNIVRLFGTAQNITERKLAEEEVQKLATIVKNSSEFIGIAALDAKTIYLNEGGKKIVSLNRDIKTATMFDFFAPQDLDIFQNEVIPVIMDKGRWIGEIHLRNFETGERIPVQMDIFYVYQTNTNKPIAFATVTINISERKKSQEKLELQNAELIKTNSELDRFVYSVSHDLRSPLTSVLGLLNFLENESNEPNTLKYAGMIRTSINRQDEFIKNILSYSQNNRAEVEAEKIDILRNLNEIADSLRNLKGAEGITIEVDIKEKFPFYSDKQRFNTIMENLISNALKYHKKDLDGRYIKIKGISDSDNLYISIEDNGVGIAQEYHSKIFDMFFRLPGRAAGSGIGLYIVKETISKLNGTIEIISAEEVGTTFNIVLKNLKP